MDSLGKRRPVLVFDLDETLIATPGRRYDASSETFILTDIIINDKLIQMIRNAKERGHIILLLTNNENAKVIFNGKQGKFVDIALEELTEAYNRNSSTVEKIFDKILTAEKVDSIKRKYLKKRIDLYYKNVNGQNNIRYYAKPVKSLEDIQHMLGYDVKGEDVYFFDDDNQHKLCNECNFIHITPPFGKGEDQTNYSILNHARGGRKTRIRVPKKTRKTRKKLKELRHGI
jgi:histidinol phosphatase-like enzyme